MSVTLKIAELIQSKAADKEEKGNDVFSKIKSTVEAKPDEDIILDFENVEIVNMAFLNNAIGKIYDPKEYSLEENRIKISNMDATMLDLLKESISLAREKYL